MKNILLLLLYIISHISFTQVASTDTLSASPNPCDSVLKIHFRTAETQPISLHVFDMTGKTIHSFFENSLFSSGIYDITYRTDTLPDGMYLVKLTLNSGYLATKFIKSGTLATVSLKKTTPHVYPNPVSDNLTINFDGNKHILIFDKTGTLIQAISTSKTSISVSLLPIGTYFIQVKTDKGELLEELQLAKTN